MERPKCIYEVWLPSDATQADIDAIYTTVTEELGSGWVVFVITSNEVKQTQTKAYIT
jgi:hypothetical protein